MKRFQDNNTALWNEHTSKFTKLIMPPVSLHDEIRTDGREMALIELLVEVGLLHETNNDVSGSKTWEACADYPKKMFIFVLMVCKLNDIDVSIGNF